MKESFESPFENTKQHNKGNTVYSTASFEFSFNLKISSPKRLCERALKFLKNQKYDFSQQISDSKINTRTKKTFLNINNTTISTPL